MTKRVGIYLRISDDAEGLGLGVGRQEVDTRKVAGRREWEVVEVYVDNDLSAFKVDVVRPDFERALRDVESGHIDGLVPYDLDRFARQPADLERAIALFDKKPGSVFATVQGDIDLSSSDGRTMARVMVTFANKSSMDTSRRVKRKHLELAQRGLPVGGNRSFGWDAGGKKLDPDEADLLRQAALDVLAGATLHGICRDWTERGVLTPARPPRKKLDPKIKGGNPWRPTPLKNALLNPRIAGWRSYYGKIAVDLNGELVRGQQEPILTNDEWLAVVAVLTDPARCGVHVHPGSRKYLLSGLVRCALCSSLLAGNVNSRGFNTFAYQCPSPTSGGCGKVGVSGPKLDDHVSRLALSYLADQEVERGVTPWAKEAEVDDLVRRRTELMTAFTSGVLDGAAVFPAVGVLKTELDRLSDQRTVWLREQAIIAGTPTDIGQNWSTMEIDRKRVILGSIFQAIAVTRSSGRGGRFDPSRVTAVWR